MKQKSSFPVILAEIADLNRQIKALDLPGKIEREERVISQHDSFSVSNVNSTGVESIRIRLLALNGERQQAQADRISSERDAERINRDLARLNGMLNADDRAAGAQKEIDALGALANAAQSAVDAARDTHTEIESLVTTEGQALDRAKGDAAGVVLAQVKSGKQGKLPHVSRERLDTLTLAQEAAAAELLDTQEILAECVSNLADARREHAEATADRTARTLHIVSRDYAHALSDHKAASYACGRFFNEPDMDLLVRQLEREADCAYE